MSEMSIDQQINAIDEVVEYIGQVENDIQHLNEEVEKTLAYFLREGMRTEIVDIINSTYMGHVNDELGEIIKRMVDCDMDYLNRVRECLLMTSCEQ